MSNNEFILGNYGVFGYYRVNYDEENWKRIITELQRDYQVINAKNRGQLLDDAFNLAKAGQLSYEIALNLSKTLIEDFNYISWKSAMDAFAYFDNMLVRSNASQLYSKFLLNLVKPSFNNFGWNIEDDHLQIFQQNIVNDKACSLGYGTCVLSAKGQFYQWKNSHSGQIKKVLPNFRPVVYCQALAHGEERDWDFVWKTFKLETDSSEKFTLLKALTCTRSNDLTNKLLSFTKNGTYISAEEGPQVFIYLCHNHKVRDVVWKFMQQEWDWVYSTYGRAFFNLKRLILACTSFFSTFEELLELENFIQENSDKLGLGEVAFLQAIEEVKTNINWRNTYEETLYHWLQTVDFEDNF